MLVEVTSPEANDKVPLVRLKLWLFLNSNEPTDLFPLILTVRLEVMNSPKMTRSEDVGN